MYDPYRQQNPQLFQDTSNQNYGYEDQNYGQQHQNVGWQQQNTGFNQMPPNPNYGYPVNFPGSQFMQDPMVTNMAMQYGQNIMGQGREYVDTRFQKIVSMSKIKYFFAVDTKYVVKKLQILSFPFLQSEWSIKYSSEGDEPVQPRFDINAPDLYIPLMAFITFILLSGFCLGLQNRFSPDVLGIQASWTIVWLVIELGVIMGSIYVTAIHCKLQFLHWLSLCSYKYVGMVISLFAAISLNRTGYYLVLAYMALALVVFLFRSLRCQLQGDAQNYTTGTKRRFYLLMLISCLQPFMMWILTMSLVPNGQ